MGIAIDVAGLPVAGYMFAASPLAELSAVLHALAEPGHHGRLAAWLGATAAALDSGLAADLRDGEHLWRLARADFLLPAAPRATLAGELDDVDRLDDEAFVTAALDSGCVRKPLHATASPLTDARARRTVRARARSRGPRQVAFVERMLADPPAVRAWIRGLLEACDRAFFADAWRQVEPDVVGDARYKNDLLVRRGPAEALRAVSPAVDLDPVHERIVVDKLQDDVARANPVGITFLPTVFGAPHLVVLHAFGRRPVLQYPATVAGAAFAVEAIDTVTRRLAALSHPVRLRLCRSLARSARTTSELTEIWRLTAPEVSRHLAVLTEAGLLTRSRRGRYVYYRLDPAVATRLGQDLLQALLR